MGNLAEDQRLINKLFAELTGFKFGMGPTFDIKLDVDTLVNLGKMIPK